MERKFQISLHRRHLRYFRERRPQLRSVVSLVEIEERMGGANGFGDCSHDDLGWDTTKRNRLDALLQGKLVHWAWESGQRKDWEGFAMIPQAPDWAAVFLSYCSAICVTKLLPLSSTDNHHHRQSSELPIYLSLFSLAPRLLPSQS